MYQEDEDRGGKIGFGFSDSNFSKHFKDNFVLFEDNCTLSHNCAEKVMGALSHLMKKVLAPPSYHPQSIVNLFKLIQGCTH